MASTCSALVTPAQVRCLHTPASTIPRVVHQFVKARSALHSRKTHSRTLLVKRSRTGARQGCVTRCALDPSHLLDMHHHADSISQALQHMPFATGIGPTCAVMNCGDITYRRYADRVTLVFGCVRLDSNDDVCSNISRVYEAVMMFALGFWGVSTQFEAVQLTHRALSVVLHTQYLKLR